MAGQTRPPPLFSGLLGPPHAARRVQTRRFCEWLLAQGEPGRGRIQGKKDAHGSHIVADEAATVECSEGEPRHGRAREHRAHARRREASGGRVGGMRGVRALLATISTVVDGTQAGVECNEHGYENRQRDQVCMVRSHGMRSLHPPIRLNKSTLLESWKSPLSFHCSRPVDKPNLNFNVACLAWPAGPLPPRLW